MADGFTNAPKSSDDFDAVSTFSRHRPLSWTLTVAQSRFTEFGFHGSLVCLYHRWTSLRWQHRHDMGGLMDFAVWYLLAAVTHLAGLRSIPIVYPCVMMVDVWRTTHDVEDGYGEDRFTDVAGSPTDLWTTAVCVSLQCDADTALAWFEFWSQWVKKGHVGIWTPFFFKKKKIESGLGCERDTRSNQNMGFAWCI